jgi:hypothetical protein
MISTDTVKGMNMKVVGVSKGLNKAFKQYCIRRERTMSEMLIKFMTRACVEEGIEVEEDDEGK